MTAVRGSVQLQVDGLEILARQSLNLRRNSVLSTTEEFQERERSSINDKQWSLKLLKGQFRQKNLEDLYRRYDNKLRLGYLSMFILILISISFVHLIVVSTLTKINNNTIIAIVCYIVQVILTLPFLATLFIERIVKKYLWIKLIFSVIILTVLVLCDILVPVLVEVGQSSITDTGDEVKPLRPAYYTNILLACYIFLPIVSNYIAFIVGIIISTVYIVVFWQITYKETDSVYIELIGDILYFLGVNFIGLYYRLMNEIVSRRSFLDRRAYLESNLKLSHEKEQEERLITSILPQHVISNVWEDITKIYNKIQTNNNKVSHISEFERSYILDHENVTILYADVVNYTSMTTKLPPNLLVETLNELFGRFDEASEEHDVLRIKFLGDCYYCVSGMPKPNPLHAKSCIDFGLEMISIIKEVRENRDLDIDMRIGVHSGRVSSGLIGIIKWQYDIWSKDVTIANKMESTGKSGKVHITNKTLEELGDWARDYIIEPNYEALNEPLLKENKIVTFLISNPSRQSDDYEAQKIQFRRVSVGLAKRMKKNIQRTRLTDLNTNTRSRTTAFIDNNLMAYRKMLREADSQLSKVIDDMPSGMTFSEYTKEDNMNRLTLLFREPSWEMSFVKQPDPLFKYFIFANLIILILNMIITGITTSIMSNTTPIIDTVLAVLLVILQPLVWTQYIWIKYKGKEEPKNFIIKFFYKASIFLVWSTLTRCIIYIFVSCTLSISSLITMIECDNVSNTNCITPWHLAQACYLTLLMCFLFSRIFFILKWAVGLSLTGVYLWVVWDYRSFVLEDGSTWNANLDAKIAHTLAVVFLTFTLYWIDRQTEFRNRLDHKWKKQLKEKQKNAANSQLINNMLLHNILPKHVAEIYLDTSRSPEELYCEQYSNVAVMFASLIDYKFETGNGEKSEISMLKILNQLIVDFDTILLKQTRMKVEKIKMAGWTYMAACGLEPNRRFSLRSSTSEIESEVENMESYVDDVVFTMVEFAANMMKQLELFNKDSFQNMNLRIGISHGMITAGVVGSSKPLYDIWGNAVNMSSRMDSTGIAGKIQVTENTAIVLDRQGILTQYRGKTFVKGVNYVSTYFVPLDERYSLITKEDYMNKINNKKNDGVNYVDNNRIRRDNDNEDESYTITKF